ncbi:MAG: universal stress protein [Nocardioidaceae bacterium]
MESTRSPAIVVGVDGTAAGNAALEFAIREGAARGCAVEVVTVWNWFGPHESLAGPVTAHEARDRAQRTQNESVAQVLRTVPAAPVVSRQVIQGDPGDVLLYCSRSAAYLVVGTEHKGMLKRAVLGSVSEHCVRHATCPVVVVPASYEQAFEPPLTAEAAG